MINWWRFLGDLSCCYSSTANKNTYLRVIKLPLFSFLKLFFFFFYCFNNTRIVNRLVKEGSQWAGPLLNACFWWFWIDVSFMCSSSKHTLHVPILLIVDSIFNVLNEKRENLGWVVSSTDTQDTITLKTAALRKLFTGKDSYSTNLSVFPSLTDNLLDLLISVCVFIPSLCDIFIILLLNTDCF